jgi:hypothetical protein
MTTDIIDVQCFFTPHRTKHFEQLVESDNCTFEKLSIPDNPNPRRWAKIVKADSQTIILNPIKSSFILSPAFDSPFFDCPSWKSEVEENIGRVKFFVLTKS